VWATRSEARERPGPSAACRLGRSTSRAWWADPVIRLRDPPRRDRARAPDGSPDWESGDYHVARRLGGRGEHGLGRRMPELARIVPYLGRQVQQRHDCSCRPNELSYGTQCFPTHADSIPRLAVEPNGSVVQPQSEHSGEFRQRQFRRIPDSNNLPQICSRCRAESIRERSLSTLPVAGSEDILNCRRVLLDPPPVLDSTA
jgi:hypothetical protein